MKTLLHAYLVLLMVAVFFAWVCNRPDKPKSCPVTHPTTKVAQDTAPQMNDSILRAYAALVGIPDSELNMVVRLARIESGNYRSRVCRENLNLFGIKTPGRYSRYTTCVGNRNGYAVYDTYLMSVCDLKLYFDRYGYSLAGYSDVENYRGFLME